MIVWLTSTVSVTEVKNQTINLIIIPLHLKKKNVNLKTTEVKSFSVHRKRAKPHMQQSATSKNFSACGGLSASFLNSAPSTSNSCIRHWFCKLPFTRNYAAWWLVSVRRECRHSAFVRCPSITFRYWQAYWRRYESRRSPKTKLENKKIRRRTIFNLAVGILLPFDQIAVICVLFWIKFQNFVQIGLPAAE